MRSEPERSGGEQVSIFLDNQPWVAMLKAVEVKNL